MGIIVVDHGTEIERLDLVRRLTAAAPSWGLWKNAASAISGVGDLDSIVLPNEVDAVERAFADWAADHGHEPALRCTHAGDLMRVVVAVDRRSETLVELDLTTRKTWRGSTLFTVPELEPAMEMDERGFRRMRAGTEAVLLLFHNGMRSWGGPRADQIERRGIVAALAADPDGVRLGTALFGWADPAARRVARAVAAGRWDPLAATTVVLRSASRAVLEPRGLATRVWFRAVTKKRCPIIRLAYTPGRSLPDDIDSWIAGALPTHERLWPAP